jgi:hypothetical protein
MREKGRVRVSVKEEWDEYASFFLDLPSSSSSSSSSLVALRRV